MKKITFNALLNHNAHNYTSAFTRAACMLDDGNERNDYI